MSIKMKIAGILAGLLVAQAAVFADQATEIMNNPDLTPAQKETQVAAAILALNENGGDVCGFAQNVIDLTPEESKDSMLAVAVIAVSSTTNAPQILACIVAAVDVADGAKIVAVAALSAPDTGLDTQALNTALQNAGIDAAKMAILNQAAANPASVMSPATVQAARNTVAKVVPAKKLIVNPNITSTDGYGLSRR